MVRPYIGVPTYVVGIKRLFVVTRLLITGGAGFIGTNFVRYWAKQHPGDPIVVLDVLSYAGDRSNLDGVPHLFVHGDIKDTALVRLLLRDHSIDTIVHFAAESHVDRSIAGPGCFHRDKYRGHQKYARGCARRMARSPRRTTASFSPHLD